MVGSGAPLALWGGAECSVVRIGDGRRDQLVETGHWDRLSDLDRVADLGIRTLRFPILWEKVAPVEADRLDFRWSDARLARLQARGIHVIAGLLHHGSGPSRTHLLDPDFPQLFADYALRVAQHHPWIRRWTPINEPLTTARFSALYGHWYPHHRSEKSFLKALANQCAAIQQAMRAIRSVIPEAELVQTEDLGKTFSTAPLLYQAAYENDRRWLSLDLLHGRVGPAHHWHRRMIDAGVDPDLLDALACGDAAPATIGINHYLTSERFLDHRLHLYPGPPGGNGRDLYADVEAVRVLELADQVGIVPRLEEAWRRYRRPIAITEVHHGCHREDQLRWFIHVWDGALALRDRGVDLRAVTLWSLFGALDWRSLLTERRGHYDAGAFDIREEGRPRPTVLAHAASHLARGERFDHPVLDAPGWWHRPLRFYAWCDHPPAADPLPGRPVLITGATGTLGRALARICEARGLAFRITARAELDLSSPTSISAAIERHRPWAIVNAAGFVRVADAERESASCIAANLTGPENLARACAAASVRLVTFSSDLVFDGCLGRLYREDDPVCPDGAYGQSKSLAEQAVLRILPSALIIRTAAFFGPWDRYNFPQAVIDALDEGRPFHACDRTFVSPTYVPDLCHAALDLLVDEVSGIRHLANPGRVSWHEFACRVATGLGMDAAAVQPTGASETRSTALGSRHGALLRPFDEALADYLEEMRRSRAAAAGLAPVIRADAAE